MAVKRRFGVRGGAARIQYRRLKGCEVGMGVIWSAAVPVKRTTDSIQHRRRWSRVVRAQAV
jgi:hypothetical protein